MPIDALAAQPCSIARTLSVVGERWTLIVLTELFRGRRRFEQIQAMRGIASNILSRRLQTLVDEGIAERHRYGDHPNRFEYRLTEKGRALQPVLLALLRWGDTYTAGEAGPPVETVHTTCDHVFHMVPTCSHCGEEIVPREVRARSGPGAPLAAV
jgi:DNA-binding HxlR family transcriptional regulator